MSPSCRQADFSSIKHWYILWTYNDTIVQKPLLVRSSLSGIYLLILHYCQLVVKQTLKPSELEQL